MPLKQTSIYCYCNISITINCHHTKKEPQNISGMGGIRFQLCTEKFVSKKGMTFGFLSSFMNCARRRI